MDVVIDALLVSILLTFYFSSMGLGLNLIFGVMRVVNLAHGTLFMMGSFLAISLFMTYHFNPAMSLLIVIPVFALIAVPMYFAFVPKLSQSKDPEMASFVLFFGVAYVIQSIALTLYGTTRYSIPNTSYGIHSVAIAGYFIPFSYFVATIFAIAALLFVYFYLYWTRMGLSTRALMDNRQIAITSGVSVTKISLVAFALGTAIVAATGVFSSQILFNTQQDIGGIITVTSFSIIIIGGLGKPLATIAGGIVYAFSYEFSAIYLPEWINVIPFFILVVVIILRPTGLFGGRAREV